MPITTEAVTEYQTQICIDVPEGCFDDVQGTFGVQDGCVYLKSIRLGGLELPANQVMQMIGVQEVNRLGNYAEERFYEDHPSGTTQEEAA